MESIKADVICPTVCYSCLMTTICTASLIFLIRLLLSMTDENVHSQNICLYVCTLMQSTWRGIITCFFYFSFSKWINLLIVFLSRDFNSNRWNGNIAECFCFQPRCPFLAIYILIYGLTWNEHPSLSRKKSPNVPTRNYRIHVWYCNKQRLSNNSIPAWPHLH